MTIRLHRGDLPDLSRYRQSAAVDTETMGLDHHRDRLCVVQLSPGDGTADVIQIPHGGAPAANLRALLMDPGVLKIFHFARFDLGALQVSFGMLSTPGDSSKIGSRRVHMDPHYQGSQDRTVKLLYIEFSTEHD